MFNSVRPVVGRLSCLALLALVLYVKRRWARRVLMRRRCGEAEWAVRVELAALYRIAAVRGWDEVIYNHITARVPGKDELLVKGFDVRHDEVTASNLVRIDMEGRVLDGGSRAVTQVNLAGVVIHTAVHAARPDASCVIHHHDESAVAVASLKGEFVVTSQQAAIIAPRVSPRHHVYEGISVDADEKALIQADLGSYNVMFLENHGVVVVGDTIPAAYFFTETLDMACKQTCHHLAAAGGDTSRLTHVAPEVVEDITRRLDKFPGWRQWGQREFKAMVRALGDASYRN
eukprot:Rhum_TRINITY_DN13879_c0_g1::Rhum_TRINITY_DN13879_c0_g1_i1::g.65204::m.65204/K18622/ADD; adducin